MVNILHLVVKPIVRNRVEKLEFRQVRGLKS